MTITLGDIDRKRLSARVGFLRHLGAVTAARIARMIEATRQKRARRKSMVRLADLEDWQLDDIGVTRAEVERALVEAGIHRDPPQLFDRS